MSYSVVCLSLAVSLPEHGVNNGLFGFLLHQNSLSTQLPLVVLALLAVGRVAIQQNCRKTAMVELESYTKRNGSNRRLVPKHNFNVQWMRAYTSQAQCAGAGFILGSLELVRWVVSFDKGSMGSIISHVCAVYDFLTPFTISALLYGLNKALLRFTIVEVQWDPEMKMSVARNDGIISERLFTSAIGFYNSVANTLKSATIFRMLSYVSYFTPSLFAKVFEVVFGVVWMLLNR